MITLEKLITDLKAESLNEIVGGAHRGMGLGAKGKGYGKGGKKGMGGGSSMTSGKSMSKTTADTSSHSSMMM